VGAAGQELVKTLIKDLQEAWETFPCDVSEMFAASLIYVFPLLISSSLTLAATSVGQSPVCALIGVSISSSSDVYYPGTNFSTMLQSILISKSFS